MATTISVPEELKSRLDRVKIHPRETYREVIERLVAERKPVPRAELIEQLREIRQKNSGAPFDSTRIIREMRDHDRLERPRRKGGPFSLEK